MKFKEISQLLSVSESGMFAQTKMFAALPSTQMTDLDKKVLAGASLYLDQKRASVNDNVEVPQGQPVLTEERYVYKDFRALSQSLLRNRGLDFTGAGVLEKAVPMVLGKTVYPNHDFTDINNWVGVVSAAKWDAEGAQSDGVPGINVQVKLDAYLNYRIACGLMMTPPAINAMSLTVFFSFEYSHPQLAIESRWKFFELLGEEVDGEIVRMVVTEIHEIWEASLVFQGEDRLAKGLAGNDVKSFSAEEAESAADELLPTSTEEEKKTVKLTTERKAQLGIEVDGDEVPDEQVFEAIDKLSAQAAKAAGLPDNVEDLKRDAAAGVTLVTAKRAEVTRLAKIAELGGNEGDLDEVVSAQIEAADADGLIKLEKYFGKKVEERFPNGGRSSMEDSMAVDLAAGEGEEVEELPKVGLL